MDAASLLTGLLLGALLATAVTLGAVALVARRRPGEAGLEPVHESLDHLHRLLAGIERARATAHGELREQMGTVGQASAQLKQETAALFVPCHRVLGSGGGMGGFRWGTPVKRWLLDHEAAHAPVPA